MRCMGLDVSKTATGWGMVTPEGSYGGSLRCPIKKPGDAASIDGAYSGEVAVWFSRSVHALLIKEKPDKVAIEQPLVGNTTFKKTIVDTSTEWAGKAIRKVDAGKTNLATVHVLHGLAFEACRLCVLLGIDCSFVASQTWRSTVGIGRAPKGVKNTSSWYKDAAKTLCKHLSIDVRSGDAAEGVCIALHLQKIHNREDLFSKAS